MHNFTPLESVVGGVVIGLAVSLLLLGNGRIAGISGIVGGVLRATPSDLAWRVLFIAGLLTGGLLMFGVQPEWFAIRIDRSLGAIAVAGVLVGFGTRLGSGCTSGHGVCGISRMSPRSLIATVSFIAAGAGMAFVVTQLFGGTV